MIPRYQKILLAVLVVASLVMGAVLWHMRNKAHQDLVEGHDSAPTQAPHVAADAQATLLVANDDDNSLREQVYSLPLPSEDEDRARAILNKLLEIYAADNSTHPVTTDPGSSQPNSAQPNLALVNPVQQVFLLPAAASDQTPGSKSAPNPAAGPQQAIVNLTSSFIASHPSGLEAESLTILSIAGTLHANLPRVTQVRFLVDGETHASFAGHADLTRTYLVSDAVSPSGPTHE
jgi:hypothetical protein